MVCDQPQSCYEHSSIKYPDDVASVLEAHQTAISSLTAVLLKQTRPLLVRPDGAGPCRKGVPIINAGFALSGGAQRGETTVEAN